MFFGRGAGTDLPLPASTPKVLSKENPFSMSRTMLFVAAATTMVLAVTVREASISPTRCVVDAIEAVTWARNLSSMDSAYALADCRKTDQLD